MAVSVGACAIGVGSMIYPYFLDWLILNYGLKGTLLILGGITLNTIPLAFTWRSSEQNAPVCDCMCTSKKNTGQNSTCDICASVKLTFKYPPFPFLMFGLSLSSIGTTVFDIVALDIVESVGMSRDQSVSAYVALKAASIPARLVPGFISKIPGCSSVMTPVVASLLGAIAMISLNYTTGFIGNVHNCIYFISTFI